MSRVTFYLGALKTECKGARVAERAQVRSSAGMETIALPGDSKRGNTDKLASVLLVSHTQQYYFSFVLIKITLLLIFRTAILNTNTLAHLKNITF